MLQRISNEQRERWIAEAMASGPTLSDEFVARLNAKPSTIITQTIREFFAVISRDKAGILCIARMEDGQFAIGDNVPRFGYKFSVYYKPPEQTRLL